ncbi:MAG: GNAT family N-acetyltransferase [Bacilli bacterium]|nr:GNAT family N-acetyltransferase [Bacilli bacterium]
MNKKNISLYIPRLEDYWYEAKLQSDPNTMSYNAGYDVSYFGYHYDTGCIDFPKEKWEEVYNKRINENKFFAYIKDNDLDEFVGYCNYHYNKSKDRYECGILIESKYRGKGYSKESLNLLRNKAKENGIKSLFDNFEIDRDNTLNIFESVGFKIVKETIWKKFNKDVVGVEVKIDL